MNDLKEKLLEKSINFWIRNVLRIMAWIILCFYVIFRILLPLTNHDKVVLHGTDGWVIGGCLALLLTIEGVRGYFKQKLKTLSGDK